MLCCWLQQLQEFGGPEVDKPDLLQGSGAGGGAGGNARTPLRGGSSPSLAKQLIVDPRVRYNVSRTRFGLYLIGFHVRNDTNQFDFRFIIIYSFFSGFVRSR